MENYKICSTCHQNLPVTEFNCDASRKNGISYECRECKKQYKHENRSFLLIAQKTRRRKTKTDLSPKQKAWNKIYYALKVGKITKPIVCSICGKPAKIIQGHHKDYSKPFEVIWCCQSCHVPLDMERKGVYYANQG